MTQPALKDILHVGALLDRAPGRKYSSTLRFAELALRAPLPRPATLAHVRRDLPAGFALALRAPRDAVVSSLGALRPDEAMQASLTWLLAAADALQVRAVVFATPAELTPGARSRDLLREYVARLPRVEGRHYVWSPGGVWEPEDTGTLCAELGIVHAFDPLETLRPAGPVAYGRLRAMGHRTGFSLASLGDAIGRLLSPETSEAFLSVDAERSFDIAKRITQLLTTLDEETRSGGAPLRRQTPEGVGVLGASEDELEDDEELGEGDDEALGEGDDEALEDDELGEDDELDEDADEAEDDDEPDDKRQAGASDSVDEDAPGARRRPRLT